MSWLILILISVVLSSFVSILQRIMLKDKDSDPFIYSVVFQLIVACLIGVFAFLTGKLVFSNMSSIVVNLLLMTVLYGLGNIFIFKSLKQTEASKFVVIFASRALFSTIGFVLILGQSYGIKELVGTLLIILSVIIVNYRKGTLSISKSDIPALLAGLCFGLANINDKILLQSIPLYPFVFIAFLFPSLLMLAIRPQLILKLRIVFNKSQIKTMLVTSLFYGICAITFFSALQIAEFPSKVVTINLVGVILTVIMGILLLKEKNNALLKIVGAVISVIGIYLVS